MRALYVALVYLLAPLLWANLWLKGLRDPELHRRRREYFGHVAAPTQPVAVWLHAVSVGEVQAALPLIRALVRQHGPGRVWVTTGTTTGSARVQTALGAQVLHSYAPYDLPHAVRRFIQHVKPRQALMMETEIWPNRFRALHAQGTPLFIVNARISDRTFRTYQRLGSFTRSVLTTVRCVAAQSEPDAARFRALGASSVVCTGNLKFDAEPDAAQGEQGRALRHRLGTTRPVWVAASTHQGEERMALEAHQALLKTRPDALLILVPRHPQRFDAVAEEIRRSGLVHGRRSQPDTAAPQVLLGDSMGEMWCYLAAADLAFVGGSLVPVGGHNVLEPAALGLPVLFGPYMQNFVDARDALLATGAARQVADAAELSRAVAEIWSNHVAAKTMGAAGMTVTETNRGALQKTLAAISAA